MRSIVGEALGDEEILLDLPLMDAGIDSLGAVAVRNSIGTAFAHLSVPSVLVFDHPTIRAIADYIAAEV